jgi:hypothetical protein
MREKRREWSEAREESKPKSPIHSFLLRVGLRHSEITCWEPLRSTSRQTDKKQTAQPDAARGGEITRKNEEERDRLSD